MDDLAKELLWVSRDGAMSAATALRRGFYDVSLAPDGARALVVQQSADDDLWLLDFSRDISTRLTFGTENLGPAWAADGRRFLWSSDRNGEFNVYLSSLDDLTAVEQVAPGEKEQTDGVWSADGNHVVYTEADPETHGDIWTVPLGANEERRPRALYQTAFDERLPSLSPDGRWLAYTSDETGRVEVYVRAFPGAGPKQQVSDGRGVDTTSILGPGNLRPLRWSRDGRELFYWDRDRLMSVEIRPGSAIDSGAPRVVFEMSEVVHFDVAPDGKRFLVTRKIPVKPLTRIIVALGGASEIGSGDS